MPVVPKSNSVLRPMQLKPFHYPKDQRLNCAISSQISIPPQDFIEDVLASEHTSFMPFSEMRFLYRTSQIDKGKIYVS